MSTLEIIGQEEIKGKAHWIRIGHKARLRSPDTTIVSSDALEEIVALCTKIPFRANWAEVEAEEAEHKGKHKLQFMNTLKRLNNRPFFIRGAGSFEDVYGLTPAGLFRSVPYKYDCHTDADFTWQFLSICNFQFEALLASATDPNIMAYCRKHHLPPPRMSAIIQPVVGPSLDTSISVPATSFEKYSPYQSGYFNTMFPDRTILGLVRGLGTVAMLGRDGPVFHFSPSGELIAGSAKQYRLDSIRLATGGIDNQFLTDITITGDEAQKVYTDLTRMAATFAKAAELLPEYGVDIEYAYARPNDAPFFLQGRPVRRRSESLHVPESATLLIKPDYGLGFGVKHTTTVVDLTANYSRIFREGFRQLIEFNERNSGYFLIVPAENNQWKHESGLGLEYAQFYNAGGILSLISGDREKSTRLSDANHFALICNDSDIMYMEADITPEQGSALRLQPREDYPEELQVRKQDLILMVDGNKNRSGIYLPLQTEALST